MYAGMVGFNRCISFIDVLPTRSFFPVYVFNSFFFFFYYHVLVSAFFFSGGAFGCHFGTLVASQWEKNNSIDYTLKVQLPTRALVVPTGLL